MFRRFLFRVFHPLWILFDALAPKRQDFWAFTTHHLHSDRFIENQRAMFEHIKANPAIRKLVFYRGDSADFGIEGAVNYEVVRHGSLRGLMLLARCKVVFLTHSISMDFSLRWPDGSFEVLELALGRRVVVNLWHGVPLKRLLYAANEATFRHTDRVPYRVKERRGYAGLVTSSEVDSYAMAAMFYPLNYRQVWMTGLPRNDFLINEETRLPRYIRESIDQIRRVRQERRLVIYAPTYRQVNVSSAAHYYQFSIEEIDRLKSILEANDAMLGYRPHYFRNSTDYFNLDQFIDGRLIVDMSQAVVPEFSAIARECELLITDYSSVFIETLFLGKPAICFAYDLENYQSEQDGLLYDLAMVFPGQICHSFDELVSALATRLEHSDSMPGESTSFQRRFFFRYQDGKNCERVRKRIESRIAGTKGYPG